MSVSVPSIVFVCKECAEIFYFDFDLKNTTVLWTDNLISDTVR